MAYSSKLAEVVLFFGLDWVVSVRATNGSGEVWPVDHTRQRFDLSVDKPKASGVLVYMILDDLVDGYFGALEVSEDVIEDLEERIFADNGAGDEKRMQQQLFAIRRDLLRFRRAVAPLRAAVDEMLQGGEKWVDELTLVRLQDVEDHIIRAVDQIDSQRELVSNAVDSHLAIMSNHMNEVMKKMTSWGALLIGSTLIAGIYGMNFDHMPELHWRLGYAWALGLMATLTVVGYSYFKRKDWL